MKKALFALTLILSMVVIFACASKPITTREEIDDAFKKVYQQFRNDIILEGAGTYTVVSGDTLSKIARAQYGSSNGLYFPLIMLASSDVVLDPDEIKPDMKLTIPDLQKNLDDAKAKGKIKSFLVEIAKVYDRRGKFASTADGLRELAASL